MERESVGKGQVKVNNKNKNICLFLFFNLKKIKKGIKIKKEEIFFLIYFFLPLVLKYLN